MKRKTTYKLSKASQAEPLKDALAMPVVAPAVAAAASMIRTQIYLTQREYDFLQTEGTRLAEPMAAVIRSFIDERMTVPDEAWENNPLLKPPADPTFIGPEDGIINHDHYIYGGPKKWMKRRSQWVEAPPLPDNYYTDQAAAAAYDRMVEEGK